MNRTSLESQQSPSVSASPLPSADGRPVPNEGEGRPVCHSPSGNDRKTVCQNSAEGHGRPVPNGGEGRCIYRFPSGPRCRKPASKVHPDLCDVHLHHASALPGNADLTIGAVSPDPDPALAADLLSAAGDLSTAGDVNRVMRKIFQAMVERRISPKEAGVLCYIAQTILHTHSAIAYQQKLDAEANRAAEEEDPSKPPILTWNLPPVREHPEWVNRFAGVSLSNRESAEADDES